MPRRHVPRRRRAGHRRGTVEGSSPVHTRALGGRETALSTTSRHDAGHRHGLGDLAPPEYTGTDRVGPRLRGSSQKLRSPTRATVPNSSSPVAEKASPTLDRPILRRTRAERHLLLFLGLPSAGGHGRGSRWSHVEDVRDGPDDGDARPLARARLADGKHSPDEGPRSPKGSITLDLLVATPRRPGRPA